VKHSHYAHDALDREEQIGQLALLEADDADNKGQEVDSAHAVAHQRCERVHKILVILANTVFCDFFSTKLLFAEPASSVADNFDAAEEGLDGVEDPGARAQHVDCLGVAHALPEREHLF